MTALWAVISPYCPNRGHHLFLSHLRNKKDQVNNVSPIGEKKGKPSATDG